ERVVRVRVERLGQQVVGACRAVADRHALTVRGVTGVGDLRVVRPLQQVAAGIEQVQVQVAAVYGEIDRGRAERRQGARQREPVEVVAVGHHQPGDRAARGDRAQIRGGGEEVVV